jgi:dihydrofolate reductase
METISCKPKTRPSSELFVVPQKNCHPPSSRSCETSATLGPRAIRAHGQVDTLLLGRVTYEMFSQFWPAVTQGEEKEFADKFNGLKKVVFSKTLERAPWGKWPEGRIVKGNPAGEIAKLKKQPGKDMLISGSISIGQALSEANLVDEYT